MTTLYSVPHTDILCEMMNNFDPTNISLPLVCGALSALRLNIYKPEQKMSYLLPLLTFPVQMYSPVGFNVYWIAIQSVTLYEATLMRK